MATILVAEDKESLRSMLEEMLRAEGWGVSGVGSGTQAIERLRAGGNVDLVLTDWRLPGADGLAVLDAAHALDATLPVIVMTAFGSIETAVDAMKRGAEDFITKPVDPELFGHESGAFTGAAARHLGKFELADGGTVFLDEIGELSAATQGKLLRVLQEKSFHRVGGTAVITADVRIITASNRPLEKLVAQNLFREDLYYRVRVFPIQIPPLRERVDDIDSLINWFLARLPGELKKKPLELDRAARERMHRYPWPGNVRELRNCLERAMILAEAGRIEERHLRLSPEPVGIPPPGRDREETLEEVRERGARAAERLWLARALERSRGDRTAAAEALSLSRRKFEAKLKEHG